MVNDQDAPFFKWVETDGGQCSSDSKMKVSRVRRHPPYFAFTASKSLGAQVGFPCFSISSGTVP